MTISRLSPGSSYLRTKVITKLIIFDRFRESMNVFNIKILTHRPKHIHTYRHDNLTYLSILLFLYMIFNIYSYLLYYYHIFERTKEGTKVRTNEGNI